MISLNICQSSATNRLGIGSDESNAVVFERAVLDEAPSPH
jgi:hypothetical protein